MKSVSEHVDPSALPWAVVEAMRATRPEVVTASSWSSLGLAGGDRLSQIRDGFSKLQLPSLLRVHGPHTGDEFGSATDDLSRAAVVEGGCLGWQATRAWTLDSLGAALTDCPMICGLTAAGDEVRVPFTDFAAYVLAQDHDAPLYLFNDEWGGAARALLSDFDPPAWAEDLLSHAPAHLRPPYRWLLVGPKRSGTLPHVDPLGTCAWNALISGEKLWVLWEPSDASVAGLVHDGAWSGVPTVCFQRLLEASEAGACALPRVFVQRPGDVVFVPAGWSHGVLNLSDTIAITENFVPSSKLAAAIAITRERRPRLGIGWERGLAKAGVEV